MPKEENKKLCKLVKKDFHKNNLKEYSRLVKNPKFICEKCGKVAGEEKNLCKPLKLEG